MRLIDADELLTHIEDFGEGQYRLNLIDPYYVRNALTVEAIPKADYEARLKADIVAMLEVIKLRIDNLTEPLNRDRVNYCIQERIDALRGGENEQK